MLVMIVTGVILGVCAISGLIRGFTGKISGLLSFVLSIALVNALLPTVTVVLREQTPVYTFIKERCADIGENIVRNMIAGQLSGNSSTGQSGSWSSSGQSAGTGTSQGNGGTVSIPSDSFDSLGSGSGIDRDKAKGLLEQYGYDSSIVDSLSDEELEAYAQKFLGTYAGSVAFNGLLAFQLPLGLTLPGPLLPAENPSTSFNSSIMPGGLTSTLSSAILQGDFTSTLSSAILPENISTTLNSAALPEDPTSASGSAILLEGLPSVVSDGSSAESLNGSSALDYLRQLSAGMTRVDQTKFIDSLPLPEALKEQLQAFNNSEGYAKLGADDFSSYIIGYIANLILNIVAFLLTLLISWIIIRTVIGALGLFANLPILQTVDRIGGFLLGAVEGVLIIWVLFLILSLASATELGQQLLTEIYSNPYLEFLYNNNLLLKISTGALQSIM